MWKDGMPELCNEAAFQFTLERPNQEVVYYLPTSSSDMAHFGNAAGRMSKTPVSWRA